MNFSPRLADQKQVEPPLHILLASQSVGRRSLLEKLGLKFRTVVTNVDEDAIVHDDPLVTIKKRATAKIDEVIKHPRVYAIVEEAKTLVITADSMAVLGKKTFGKAQDKEHAKEILKSLMDKTHIFATAISVSFMEGHKEKKRWEKTITTKVSMRKLTQPELDLYVHRYDFSRFAAAYTINETPWDLITKIDGSYTNVIGLPFEVLLPILRSLDIVKIPENPFQKTTPLVTTPKATK